MKVNTSKTEFCVFSCKDIQRKEIILCGTTIKSSYSIKVLGVEFDSRLEWSKHVMNVLTTCKKTMYGLRQIRRYFDVAEFLNVVNAMFYSKMYYASQVWLISNLNSKLKRKLFSLSGNALKILAGDDFGLFSFEELHILFNRASPLKWSNYTHANQLFSIINNNVPHNIWLSLQDHITINNRTDFFNVESTNTKRVGYNSFQNRIGVISHSLKFSDFNLSKEAFKLKTKNLFLM